MVVDQGRRPDQIRLERGADELTITIELGSRQAPARSGGRQAVGTKGGVASPSSAVYAAPKQDVTASRRADSSRERSGSPRTSHSKPARP